MIFLNYIIFFIYLKSLFFILKGGGAIRVTVIQLYNGCSKAGFRENPNFINVSSMAKRGRGSLEC